MRTINEQYAKYVALQWPNSAVKVTKGVLKLWSILIEAQIIQVCIHLPETAVPIPILQLFSCAFPIVNAM